MAGSMSDVYEKRVLDLIFRNANASATVPLGLDATNVWIGLFTATPSDAGGGTEVSTTSTGYARVAVNRTGTGWNAATGTLATTTNAVAVTFPTATASWGTVTQWGAFDAVTAGNLIYWADLSVAKTIGINDVATFAANTGLTITQD